MDETRMKVLLEGMRMIRASFEQQVKSKALTPQQAHEEGVRLFGQWKEQQGFTDEEVEEGARRFTAEQSFALPSAPEPVASLPPATSISENPYLSPTPTQPLPASPDEEGERIARIFSGLGATCTFKQAIASPYSRVTQYQVQPDPSVPVKKFKTYNEDFIVHLGCPSAPVVRPISGAIAVEVPKKSFQPVPFNRFVRHRKSTPFDDFKLPIGVDLLGNLVYLDMSVPHAPHTLIVGTSGSGKSNLQEVILHAATQLFSPDHLQLLLIDFQKVNFVHYKHLPHLWQHHGIVTEPEGALEAFEAMKEEQSKREVLFARRGARNLLEYNKLSDEPLPRILSLCDEVRPVKNSFINFEGKLDPDLHDRYVTEGAEQFRKFGIHLILCTQYPRVVVTPAMRECLTNRLVGYCNTKEASEAALENDAARYLTGKGDFLSQVGTEMQRVSTFFCSPSESDELIAEVIARYPKKQQQVPDSVMSRILPTIEEPQPIQLPSLEEEGEDEDLLALVQLCERKKMSERKMLEVCFNQKSPADGNNLYRNRKKVQALLGREYAIR